MDKIQSMSSTLQKRKTSKQIIICCHQLFRIIVPLITPSYVFKQYLPSLPRSKLYLEIINFFVTFEVLGSNHINSFCKLSSIKMPYLIDHYYEINMQVTHSQDGKHVATHWFIQPHLHILKNNRIRSRPVFD